MRKSPSGFPHATYGVPCQTALTYSQIWNRQCQPQFNEPPIRISYS